MVLGLGDMYDGNFTSLQDYLDDRALYEIPWLNSNAPVHWVLGNHDNWGISDDQYTSNNSFMTTKNYTVDLDSSWRIVIYSNVDGTYFSADATTLTWLQNTLEQARLDGKKIIIATHVRIDQDYPGNPPATLPLGFEMISYNAESQRNIINTAKANGANIKYVFQGHEHTNGKTTINGIDYYEFTTADVANSAAIVTIKDDDTLEIVGLGSQTSYNVTDFYVDSQNGNDSNIGTSQTKAWATLNRMMATGNTPGVTIHILPGIYREYVNLTGLIGSDGNYITWNFSNNAKISCADIVSNSGWSGPDTNGWYTKSLTTEAKVVIEDAVLLTEGTYSGVSSTGQWDWNSNTLYYHPTTGTPSDHTIEAGQRGTGINFPAGSQYLNINNAEVYGCNTRGIGIFNSASHIGLYDTKVWGNDYGLDVENTTTNPITISRIIARNNKGTGIYIGGSSNMALSYALVYGNNPSISGTSGITDSSSGSPTIYNATIYNNRNGLQLGAGTPTVKNIITYGNSIRGINAYGTVGGSISYSYINDGELWGGSTTITHSDHYFTGNPKLINPASKNFYLQPSSPAIDAGTNVSLTSDLAGNSVPQGSAPDIGAYEYIPLTVTINQANGQVDPTNSSTINYSVIFSESVSDFATGDVILSGTAGATTGTVTGSGITYNIAVTGMTGGGTVIASLAAGVATGATGNTNAVSTSTDNTVTYDITPPTLTTITISDTTGYTNSATPTITIISSGSPSHVAFSCNGGANWSSWIVYADSISSFNITNGATGCATSDGSKAITAKLKDSAGNESSTVNDSTYYDATVPSGGSITYNDGNYTSTTALTVNDGTDTASGINTSTRTVQRKTATLTNGSCGTFGSFTSISPTGSYPNFTDTSTTTGFCYQYQYLVSDNAGNLATYTSSNVAKTVYAEPGTTSCGNTIPTGNPPWLYEANAGSGSSITLRFTNWQSPVDHFALEYGTSSNNYQYAADNIGAKDTNSYTVNSLKPNTTYYFRVRAGNGCATGVWSNELSTKTLGSFSTNNLNITESSITPVEQPSSCKTYSVKSGDTLWSIAKSLLGDGSKYTDITNENSDSYLSLKTSDNLSIGWNLKVNCSNEVNKSPESTPIEGYKVNIKVKDTKGSPIENATVTLHSTPQTEKTNSEGVATFNNVEQGNHTVDIAYNNYQGEQSINLTGDVKEFNINVTVQQKLFSPLAYGIIGGLVIIICFLTFNRIKKNK